MALTKTDSSVMESAVSSVSNISGSGAASAATASDNSDASLLIMIGNDPQSQTNLIMTLTGPGNYKKKVAFTGNSKSNLATEVQTSSGDWTVVETSATVTGTSGASGGGLSVTAGSIPVGGAGAYELHIDCNGAPVRFPILIPRASGPETTRFDFDGFSHGEATYKFTKS